MNIKYTQNDKELKFGDIFLTDKDDLLIVLREEVTVTYDLKTGIYVGVFDSLAELNIYYKEHVKQVFKNIELS